MPEHLSEMVRQRRGGIRPIISAMTRLGEPDPDRSGSPEPLNGYASRGVQPGRSYSSTLATDREATRSDRTGSRDSVPTRPPIRPVPLRAVARPGPRVGRHPDRGRTGRDGAGPTQIMWTTPHVLNLSAYARSFRTVRFRAPIESATASRLSVVPAEPCDIGRPGRSCYDTYRRERRWHKGLAQTVGYLRPGRMKIAGRAGSYRRARPARLLL